MDEQASPDGTDEQAGPEGTDEQQGVPEEAADEVTTVDLSDPSGDGAAGAAPTRGAWAGRIAIAGLAVAMIAGGVALARDDGGDTSGGDDLQPLALSIGGNATGADEADAALYPAVYEYRLDGELPDLGSEAPVYRLTQPALGAAEVAQMAEALGIEDEPESIGGRWIADDGDASLSIDPTTGAWSVSYYPGPSGYYGEDVGGGSAGSDGTTCTTLAPGESGDDIGCAVTDVDTGSGSSGATTPPSPGGEVEPTPADGSGDTNGDGVISVEDEPGVTHTVPVAPPVDEPEAPDLPSQEEAEAIARDTLDAMGVLDGADWSVAVTEGGMMGYACAEGVAIDDAGNPVGKPEVEPAVDPAVDPVCDGTPQETLLSWNVTFSREVDGVVTAGLDWWVDVGDAGSVQGVSGILTDLAPMGDYPLRTTQQAFDDLAAGDGTYPGPVPLGEPAAMGSFDEVAAPIADDADAVEVSEEASAAECVAGDGDCDDAASGELVRSRPEESASGIEPSYCGVTWCLDYPDDPMCAEPCTPESTECVIVSDDCDQFEDPCVPPPTTVPCPDDALCEGPAPTTTLVCEDTVTIPEPDIDAIDPLPDPAVDPATGTEPGTAPAMPLPACAEPPPCEGGPAVDCAPLPPECDPTLAESCPGPAPMPEPESIVVVVTGAERSAMVTWGVEDGDEVAYLVPTYRFAGHLEVDGSEWSMEVVAVSDSLITSPVPDPEPRPDTVPPDTAPATVTTEPPVTIDPDAPDCSGPTEGELGSDADGCRPPVTTIPPTSTTSTTYPVTSTVQSQQ